MASCIVDAKLKVGDLGAVVEVCVRLSCLYGEFPDALLAHFKRAMPTKHSDTISDPSKLRVDLRLVGELIVHGVFGKNGLRLLASTISYLTLTDRADHVNVPILVNFCRVLGADLLDVFPFSIQTEAAETKVTLCSPRVIPPEQKKVLAGLLLDYRTSLIEHINRDLTRLNEVVRSVKRQTRLRGDASAEERELLGELRARYEKQLQNGIALSEILGVQVEEMHEEQSDDEAEERSAQELSVALQQGVLSIWPDEDTRHFYECRLELRHIVPSILFQDSEHKQANNVCENIDDVDVNGLETLTEVNEEDLGSASDDDEEKAKRVPSEPTIVTVEPKTELSKMSGQDLKLKVNAFLEDLPSLYSREMIDNAALYFINNLSTKSCRKKLCSTMLEQHLDRLDILPFYGRLVATLQPVMPDLAIELSQSLLRQFRDMVQNQTKSRVDLKLRCCRFIAELVKFGLIPKAEALSCVRMTLFDFRGQNVDMCCALVDTMGFFLYRSTDSHPKMKILLDVMLKKRKRIGDPRRQMLVDNAYYSSVPAEEAVGTISRRPAIEEFIMQKVSELSALTTESTARSLRRLDWSNSEISGFAIRCLSSPWLLKFGSAPYLASVVASLASCHDWIGMGVLDSILEVIRMVLEVHSQSLNQKGILAVAFLGQLYNYSVCDSPVIFKTLYQLLTFGGVESTLDEWNSLFRVRLVCELLLVTGEYFDGGVVGRKLDCYLVYFFRYYRAKLDAFKLSGLDFPFEVKHQVEEMVKYVRKGLKIPSTIEDAQRAVDDLQNEYKSSTEAVFGEVQDDEESEEAEEEEKEKPRKIKQGNGETAEHVDGGSDEDARGLVVNGREDVHVHRKKRVVLPEDVEFLNQLENIVAETMQNRPTTSAVRVREVIVPTSVRQKFHKTVSFDTDAPVEGPNIAKGTRMAMLTHGKGHKTMLKPISMSVSSSLAESWSTERALQRAEFLEQKNITLSMTERMMAQEEREEEEEILHAFDGFDKKAF